MKEVIEKLKTFPSFRGWFEVLGLFVVFIFVSYLLAPNLIDINNAPKVSELVFITIIAFFVPALFEELFFRGILIKNFNFKWVLLSLLLFVLWHPFQAYLYLPKAKIVFLSFNFLFLVGVLGVFCTLAYYRTKSLWASIVLHWLVVVSWRAFGGARFIF